MGIFAKHNRCVHGISLIYCWGNMWMMSLREDGPSWSKPLGWWPPYFMGTIWCSKLSPNPWTNVLEIWSLNNFNLWTQGCFGIITNHPIHHVRTKQTTVISLEDLSVLLFLSIFFTARGFLPGAFLLVLTDVDLEQDFCSKIPDLTDKTYQNLSEHSIWHPWIYPAWSWSSWKSP